MYDLYVFGRSPLLFSFSTQKEDDERQRVDQNIFRLALTTTLITIVEFSAKYMVYSKSSAANATAKNWPSFSSTARQTSEYAMGY